MWQCVTKASTVPPFHSAKMWCAMGAQRDTGNILILECVLLMVSVTFGYLSEYPSLFFKNKYQNAHM